jgi:hypothetical protein
MVPNPILFGIKWEMNIDKVCEKVESQYLWAYPFLPLTKLDLGKYPRECLRDQQLLLLFLTLDLLEVNVCQGCIGTYKRM